MSVAHEYLRPGLLELSRTSSAVTPEAEPQLKSNAVTPEHEGEYAALIQHFVPWAEEQVVSLTQYGSNWDGYNAAPVHPEALKTSAFMLAALKAMFDVEAPCVNPVRDGGVSLEWEMNDKYLEIECGPLRRPNVVSYLFDDHESEVKSGSVAEGSMPEFVEVLKLMFSK